MSAVTEVSLKPSEQSLTLEWGLTVSDSSESWNWPHQHLNVRLYLQPFPSSIGKPDLLNSSFDTRQETITQSGTFKVPFVNLFDVSLGKETTQSAFQSDMTTADSEGKYLAIFFDNLANGKIPAGGVICYPSVRWSVETMEWVTTPIQWRAIFGIDTKRGFLTEYEATGVLNPEDLPKSIDPLTQAISQLIDLMEQQNEDAQKRTLARFEEELLLKGVSLQAGDIKNSTGVALGENIHQVVTKNEGISEDFVLQLVRMLVTGQQAGAAQPSPTKSTANRIEITESHIFISYARVDGSDAAEWLYTSLNEMGVGVWRDTRDLNPYRDMSGEIEKAIRNASYVVALITEDVRRENSFVRNELSFALRAKKPIIPLLFPQGEPPVIIANLTYIPFEDWEEGLQDLLARFETINTSDISIKAPLALPTLVSPPNTPKWIPIPEARAIIGDDSIPDAPQHVVDIPAFYISETPVTQRQYARFVKLTGHPAPYDDWYEEYSWDKVTKSPPPGKEDHPVVLVSAFDAAAYCEWLANEMSAELSKLDGEWKVMLPSEVEWEYVARGSDALPYPWGKGGPTKKLCNFDGHFGGTTSVKQFPDGKTNSSIFDMVGNVWEWTRSIKQSSSETPSYESDGDHISEPRILKGGSWQGGAAPAILMPAFRYSESPNWVADNIGFRVAIVQTNLDHEFLLAVNS